MVRIVVLLSVSLTGNLAGQASVQRTVHVFVALADNQNQGIVPVPAKLGNGFDPMHNLYWGAAGGVKTFFLRSSDWRLLNCQARPKPAILERCVFETRKGEVNLLADAYRGSAIHEAMIAFLDAASGANPEPISFSYGSRQVAFSAHGGANLVAYVGHDGLMDFPLTFYPHQRNESPRDAIILACASKQYFAPALRAAGAYPLLWTTGLMAPEAYTLKSALDGWIDGERGERVRERAAAAYDRYQHCGLRAARRLFSTGW